MVYQIFKTNKIEGEVKISGSKNAALPIIASTILFKNKVKLKNIPFITDVINMIKILKDIGCIVDYNYIEETLTIDSANINKTIKSKHINKLRASYYLMGALVSRQNTFELDYPGGCKFSKRPIDIHISSFKKLGIKIEEQEKIKFTNTLIHNATINFPKISVGATINIILASVISDVLVILNNSSIEPEVMDLINFLNKAGSNIKVENRTITIKGVKNLNSISYTIMPDRIETGSYLLLASSIPNSDLTLTNIKEDDLQIVIETLKLMGNNITLFENIVTIKSPSKIQGINLSINEYPDFPTDLQPIICTTLLKANKQSIIKDNIYPDRISHINELKKIGGDITIKNGNIIINPSNITKGKVMAHDLRCGFALVIAGVMSDEYVEIENFNHVLRGYSNIIEKLKSINIDIRVKN